MFDFRWLADLLTCLNEQSVGFIEAILCPRTGVISDTWNMGKKLVVSWISHQVVLVKAYTHSRIQVLYDFCLKVIRKEIPKVLFLLFPTL